MALEAQADRETYRELVARIADPSWIGLVAAEVTVAIHRELPELDIDDQIRPSTLASTQSVIGLWAELVRLDRPPGEAELPPAAINYARELARQGLSIDTLLRSYHVGNAVFFRAWAGRLHEVIDDGQPLAQTVEIGASWTFEFIQTLMRGLVTRFTEEREAWVRSSGAMRCEIVNSILAGEPVEQRTASQRLRYQLDREHLGYLVWCEQSTGAGEAVGELERIAFALAALVGVANPLVVPLGGLLVAAWISPPRDPVLTTLPADLQNPAGAQAAFGVSARGVAGFGATHRDAMHARRVARLAHRRAGTVTRFDDIGLTALATLDMDLATRFVNVHLGPLAAQDDDALRLSSTLRVYLEEQASPRRAAQRLGVHENTIKARVRTISELLPTAPTERPAELLVALRLARLTAPPEI